MSLNPSSGTGLSNLVLLFRYRCGRADVPSLSGRDLRRGSPTTSARASDADKERAMKPRQSARHGEPFTSWQREVWPRHQRLAAGGSDAMCYAPMHRKQKTMIFSGKFSRQKTIM